MEQTPQKTIITISGILPLTALTEYFMLYLSLCTQILTLSDSL